MAPAPSGDRGHRVSQASPHVPDPVISPKPPAPHPEHVSYVSAQVRGHLRLPAVGKIDEAHLLRYEQLETIRMLTNHNLDAD